MTVDVIILSYAKNDSIIEMNNNCINSINNSSKFHSFNIYLIETKSDQQFNYQQDNVTVIQPNEEFNYNRFLNIGLEYCNNEWVLISNNDTIYHPNFLEEMLIANKFDESLLSMSPMDDDWHVHKTMNKIYTIHYGYRTSYELTGWSIFVKRDVLKQIGGFDEQFKFWYQDNDYAETLNKFNIKHGLVTKSKVTHLLSKSHDLIENNKVQHMTNGMGYVYSNKWKSKKTN
jgi:GT2 family glycosyltransferase